MDKMQRTKNQIAKGSIQDIARQQSISLAEAFMSCDAVVICDSSGSMAVCDVDVERSQSRYTAACKELEKLQASLPGRVAVIAFSDHAEFCPSGFPRYIGAGTAMDKALTFIKVADGCGIKLVLISDGEPDRPDETLRIARTFTSKIDTIYVGREGDQGARFLRELSDATGGIATTQATNQLNQLGATVRLLIGE